jgi:hypothetical protein
MKINQKILYVILLSSLLFFSLRTNAQTFEINSTFPQQATISGPGFFPFSSISNDFFQEQFPQNMTLEANFTSFLGGPCTLAPAADFGEIGPTVSITGSGVFIVDFSMASSNADLFGLSFVPTGTPCTFNLFLTTPIVTSSSGSTSTSGGAIKTNEELISEAISLETRVKNNLSSTNPSFDDEITDLETSLSLLNELSTSFSNSTSTSTALIQKKIKCATEADNQIVTILENEENSLNKAKKLLRKALRCKKIIKKKI